MKEMGNERIVSFQFLHFMKRLSVSLAGFLMAVSLDLPAASWLSDFPAAQAKAGAENRMILMNFTGSDWCSWCVKLREEVFSTAEFNAFADQKLVLVEVDFPKRKRQRPELQKANRLLAGSFQVEGYPTIILLDSSGKRIGNSGYRPGGPKVFLSELESLSGGKLKAATALANGQPGSGRTAPPLPPPPSYAELRLKGVSRTKHRRLAIINNQTLAEGESGLVRLGQTEVKVRCVEIGDKSAIVLVGKPEERKELRLREY